MNKNIVIITGNKPHMNYFVSEMAKKLNVVSVFYFKVWKRPTLRTLEYFKSKEFRSRNKLSPSIAYDILGENNIGYNYADEIFKSKLKLKSIPAYHCEDINSEEVIEKIKEFRPDIVFCHGGPIYEEGIINCAPLVINFHSGISPNYRGAHSHLFAYIDGSKYDIGGTLMKLNSKIDGGDIIRQCRPILKHSDTPKEIFVKIMESGCSLVIDFIENYQNNNEIKLEKQIDKGKYTKNSDFNFNKLLKYYYRRFVGFKI